MLFDNNNSRNELVPISYTYDSKQNIEPPDFKALPRRIQRKIKINKKTGCWEWQAFKYGGYGRLRFKGFKTEKAHRIVYELLVGPIREGLESDHLCRNRCCVNPTHIEPVTRLENLRRSHCASSLNRIKTYCRNGHEYTRENTYTNRKKRYCRQCLAINSRRWIERKKEAIACLTPAS